MNKLGILGIVIVGTFVFGVLSANPVVEAAAGWQLAVSDLLDQITSNDNDITNHENRLIALEKPTPLFIETSKVLQPGEIDVVNSVCPNPATQSAIGGGFHLGGGNALDRIDVVIQDSHNSGQTFNGRAFGWDVAAYNGAVIPVTVTSIVICTNP